jgi:hypothetical protein
MIPHIYYNISRNLVAVFYYTRRDKVAGAGNVLNGLTTNTYILNMTTRISIPY